MRAMLAGLIAASSLAATACGEEMRPSGPTSPATSSSTRTLVSVRFEYRASTTVTAETRAMHLACARIVGGTHMHASWRDFEYQRMRPEGDDLWVMEFDDVPAPSFPSMRVNDINWCDRHPTGAVTGPLIYANGVLLSNPALTPGLGDEPGFKFRIDEDGVVTP